MNNSKMDLLLGILAIVVAGLAVVFLSGSIGVFTAIGAALVGVVLLIRAAQSEGNEAPADPLHLENSEEAGFDWDAHYQREFGNPDDNPYSQR